MQTLSAEGEPLWALSVAPISNTVRRWGSTRDGTASGGSLPAGRRRESALEDGGLILPAVPGETVGRLVEPLGEVFHGAGGCGELLGLGRELLG